MFAAIVIVGVFAAICVAAAMDPRNRRGHPDSYDDDEYFGL